MSTPEGAVLRACLDYLKLSKIAAWRINTMGTPIPSQPGRFRPAPSVGIADIVGIGEAQYIGGKGPPIPVPLAIECKAAKGRQSPAQAVFAKSWEKAGGVYIIARSVEELRLKLREAGVGCG